MRFVLVLAAFAVGFVLVVTQTPASFADKADKSDKKKKAAAKKEAEKIQYLVNEDFRDVKGTLPEGWVNRANNSAPCVVTKNLGAIHPTAGKDRVYHSFDVPAEIEGDFVIEVKFSSFRQPPLADGKPQFANLGLLLLDANKKPASKDGAVQVWQEAGTFSERGGFVTLKANGDDKRYSTKAVAMEGEGTPHTIRLERRGKDYEIAADGDVVYTGTLGDLGKQNFTGIRIGMLGGDNLTRKTAKADPVFTQVHVVKIGLKK